MKVVTYRGPRQMQVVSDPPPRIERADDLMWRVTRTARSGSDLHLHHGPVPDTPVERGVPRR